MELDLVHNIQAAYRKTVDSMARPGLISNIRTQAAKVTLDIGCFSSTLVLALMLFDTETKFKVYSGQETEITKFLNQLTYVTTTEAEKADFILVSYNAAPEDLLEALAKAYPGDLLNPHQAATVIVEADYLGNEKDLILTGPGIERENYIRVQRTGNWVDVRTAKNSEYPLGIDLIFTDPQDNILCLPRTTQIVRQVVE